jgi:CheY-like chemotaxis protein
VETGRAAVDRAASTAFDLVLMDCHMPELDGFMAVAELRARAVPGRKRERVPVIALTADVGRDVRQRCLEAGMDGYMSKPIDAGELDRVLVTWLDPAQPGNAPQVLSRPA